MQTKKIVRWLFVTIGVSLLLAAYILQIWNLPLFSDTVKEFAVVMLSVVLLDWIWSAVGGDFRRSRLEQNKDQFDYLLK